MRHSYLLRPLILQGLLHTKATSEHYDFKKWISSGNYIVREIPSNKSIRIEVNNEHVFHQMLAYDSCRMAAASFETMHNIQSIRTLPKSFGWIAIKSYYAAFFSAHSIMRCFGYTCSQLERGHVKQLNSFAEALGIEESIKPEAGFFSGTYSPDTRTHSLRKMKNTHEDTWQTLVECLNKLSQNILNTAGLSTHKQEISANIDDIIFKLTDRGRLAKGNYLSQFRNAVNYRQEYDSWHPYGKNSIKSEKVISFLSTWKNDEDFSSSVWKESLDTYNFFLTCRDLVNLNYLLTQVIIKNSQNKKNFYKRWPARLLEVTPSA